MTEKIAAASRAASIRGFVAHAEAGSEPLFEGLVAEGTEFVLADGVTGTATRARAHAIGLQIVELPLWYDIDDHAALKRLIAEIAAATIHDAWGPGEAPATELALRQMGLLAAAQAVRFE
jgi:hypothetical protein